jgi:hypothetical protein
LLTQLARALLDDDAAVLPHRPAADDPAHYAQALLRHPGWLLRALFGLPRMVAQARRVWRPGAQRADEGHNAFRAITVGAAQTRALRSAAAGGGVTLHELLSACLLLALAPLHTPRLQHARRRELAVASIMNMRRDLAPRSRRGLGPFLAAYRVAHCVPDGMAVRALATDVHRQTQRVHRGRLYLQSLLGLGVSALLWPLLTPRQRDAFYVKHFPVQAGITTIDLDRLWAEDGATPLPVAYLRAVPTGPLCPLVLAATQEHDCLHLGIAYRTGAYSHDVVEQLGTGLLLQIERATAASAP